MKLEKNEKIMLGVLAIGLAIAAVWSVGIFTEEGIGGISPQSLIVKPQPKEGAVSVGYGWSINDNGKGAVQEAVTNIKEQLGEKKPDYIMLFSTVGYDSDEVLRETRRLLPGVQVYGGTSMLSVMTK
ncbi:MAG: hypothetical protein ACE5J7_05265, partial [Candidatus Aenigmatarchaeota archaeon]